jgi:hypothetical protein
MSNRKQYNGLMTYHYLFDADAAICVTVSWTGSKGYRITNAWMEEKGQHIYLSDYPYRRSENDWQVVNHFLDKHKKEKR